MKRAHALALALIAAVTAESCVGSGGSLATVTVSDDKLCYEFPSENYPGSGTVLTNLGPDVTVSQSVTLDKSQLPDFGKSPVSADMRLVSLSMASPDGKTSYEFIRSVDVKLSSLATGTKLPQVDIATYTQPSGSQNPKELDFTTGQSVNLVPYVNEQDMQFTFAVTGKIPSQSWMANVTICFSLDASANLPPQMQSK